MLNAASTALRYGAYVMIDYLSLAIGHVLLAVAFLRLVMREQLDVDPVLQEHSEKRQAQRAAETVAGRNSRRREQAVSDDGEGRAR